jgi:ribosomal protein L9
MKLDQSDILTNTEREIVKIIRVISGDKIFYQGEDGVGLTNYSFRDLSKEQAKILGLSVEKYNEIVEGRIELTFSSQSEEDLFMNALNNALNDNIDHKLSSSCKYVLDRRNIYNIEELKGLGGKEVIFKIHHDKLM